MLGRMLPLVLTNLRRNPRRSLLTALGVAVAIFVSSALHSSILGITFPVREAGSERLLNTREALRSNVLASRLPASYEEKVAAVPGVAAATGVFADLAVTSKERIHIFVTGVDPARYRLVKPLVVDPAQWEAFQRTRSGAVVGHRLLARLGWRLGAEVQIKEIGLRVTVVGVIPPQKVDLENHLLVHRENLQLTRKAEGQVSYVLSSPAEGADPTALAAAVDSKLALAPVRTETVTASSYAEAIIRRFMGFVSYLELMGVVTVLVTMAGAANALGMSVRERTREIGMLKAIGFPARLVEGLVLAEALALAVAGGLLGVGAAALLVGSEKGSLAGLAMSPPVYLTAAASTLLIGLLGGLVPARQAARLETIDALRTVE